MTAPVGSSKRRPPFLQNPVKSTAESAASAANNPLVLVPTNAALVLVLVGLLVVAEPVELEVLLWVEVPLLSKRLSVCQEF